MLFFISSLVSLFLIFLFLLFPSFSNPNISIHHYNKSLIFFSGFFINSIVDLANVQIKDQSRIDTFLLEKPINQFSTDFCWLKFSSNISCKFCFYGTLFPFCWMFLVEFPFFPRTCRLAFSLVLFYFILFYYFTSGKRKRKNKKKREKLGWPTDCGLFV